MPSGFVKAATSQRRSFDASIRDAIFAAGPPDGSAPDRLARSASSIAANAADSKAETCSTSATVAWAGGSGVASAAVSAGGSGVASSADCAGGTGAAWLGPAAVTTSRLISRSLARSRRISSSRTFRTKTL